MGKYKILSLLLTVVFPLTVAHGAPDKVFAYYQESIQNKESGVYEWEDFVFVQVKLPYSQKDVRKIKGDALRKASNLLKQWALDQAAGDREREPKLSPGMASVWRINDKYRPDWRYPPWQICVNGREFPPSKDNGFYSVGQSYTKKDLVAAIPASYRRQPTNNEAFSMLPKYAATKYIGKSRQEFSGACGFADALLASGTEHSTMPDIDKETLSAKAFRKKLEKHIRTSGEVSLENRPAGKEYRKLASSLAEYLSRSPQCESYLRGFQVTNRVDATNIVVTTVHPEFERHFLAAGTVRPKYGLSNAAVASEHFANAENLQKVLSALQECQGDKRLWILYGKSLYETGDVLGAVASFRTALALDPLSVEAITGLAQAYEKLGCRQLAIGAAVIARSLAKEEEGIRLSEGILTKDW